MPRKNQRTCVQRGRTVNRVTAHLLLETNMCFSCLTRCAFFDGVFVYLAGHHTLAEEGGMEIPAGVLSVEQHCQGKRGHSSGQNVSIIFFPVISL